MRRKINKKVGSSRRQATAADVAKAKADAITFVWAIFFTVMRDKHGWGIKQLGRLWDEVNELADSISKGFVSVTDLTKTLEEEAGIVIK